MMVGFKLGLKSRNLVYSVKISNKGSILLLVLAVLALLSLLATTMASYQTVARNESARYIERLEAIMLAHVGIERVVAELKYDPFDISSIYWGRDIDQDELLDDGEVADTNDDGYLSEKEKDIWNAPLRWASNPSYAYRGEYSETGSKRSEEGDKNRGSGAEYREPKMVKLLTDKKQILEVGVSGFGSKGTYVKMGNTYSIKLSDLQSRIYLNDGHNLYGGNQSSVSQNLKRILNVLAGHPQVLGEDAPVDFGQMVIDNRPPGGFKTIYDVLRVLQRHYGTEKGKEIFEKVEHYVTVFAWVDKNVVNPVPLSEEVYHEYPVLYYRRGNPADFGVSSAVKANVAGKEYVKPEELPFGYNSDTMNFRRGRGMSSSKNYLFNTEGSGSVKETLRWFNRSYSSEPALDVHNAIYGLDELFPQYIEVVHRAPVNINNASEPVLAALLADLSGFFITERRRFAPYAPSPEDFSITTKAKFQDTEMIETATIPQKYQSWEYKSYSYDTGGYSLNTNNIQMTVKSDGDEYGYLYRTIPLKTQWQKSTSTESEDSIDAVEIARHMIAARKSQSYNGVDYGSTQFSGQFRRWSQFNRFADYLVEREVLRDNRAIYWNYLYKGWENPDAGDWSEGGISRYPAGRNDPAQQEFASYAVADVLKANFNPNLHLNEANPDENLWLRVDKTDLIYNSTEFCFSPMGYFAVESLGRILRPTNGLKNHELKDYNDRDKYGLNNSYKKDGSNPKSAIHNPLIGIDVFTVPVTEVASSKVQAVVKVFDVYRETSQRHFMQGEVKDKQGTEPTNSGAGLEIAPEVYNSIAFKGREGTYGSEDYYANYKFTTNEELDGYKGDNEQRIANDEQFKREMGWGAEYAGHIQLSTLGGMDEASGSLAKGKKGAVRDTPSGVPHWPTGEIGQYEGLHVHFSWDHKAHHHGSAIQLGDQYRDEVSSKTLTSNSIIGKIDPALLDPQLQVVLGKDDNGADVKDEYLAKRQTRYDINSYKKVERSDNYSDDRKFPPGPYDSKYVHRLARSFRLPLGEGNSRVTENNSEVALQLPTLDAYSPTDLRVDGAYVERNSGVAYWIDEGYSMFSWGGAVSMWLKPSFFPEHTGKARKLFSYDRWHKANYDYRNPSMFSLFFFPAHDAPPYMQSSTEDITPSYAGVRMSNKENKPTEMQTDGRGVKGFRPSSLAAGVYMHQAAGSLEDWEYDEWVTRDVIWDDFGTHNIDLEYYYNTPTLNHNLHRDGLGSASKPKVGTSISDVKRNYLEGHKWTHVVWSWLTKYDMVFYLKDAQGNNKSKNTGKFGQGKAISIGTVKIQSVQSIDNVAGGNNSAPNGNVPNIAYEFIPIKTYEHRMRVYVNGQELLGGLTIPGGSELFMTGGRRPTFSLHSFEDEPGLLTDGSAMGTGFWRGNTVRVGETSSHGFPSNYVEGSGVGANSTPLYPRNFSGDFTMDEFAIHGSSEESDGAREAALDTIESTLQSVYMKGRYYVPRVLGGGATDSAFESGPIYLNGIQREATPETLNAKRYTLLGVSWTWLAEDYDRETMEPVMYDYSTEIKYGGKVTGNPLKQGIEHKRTDGAMVRVSLQVHDRNGARKDVLGGYKDSGYSVILDPKKKGRHYVIEDSEFLKYNVNFYIESASPGSTVLLSSPVFDDITIYYTTGVKVLFYSQVEI